MSYRKIIKPLIDIVSATVFLLVLSPLIVVVLIALLIGQGGNPFFVQKRPGMNGKIFSLVKFRTMRNEYDLNGKLLPDNERLTSIGRFVRSTSLDELPQLLNVIRGDMSLVGPRPLLVRYLSRYSPEQARRHEVKPGITGWAQVNGRNLLNWEEKFKLDIYYVENISYNLDLKILRLTILNVVKREGVNSSNVTTMEEFKG